MPLRLNDIELAKTFIAGWRAAKAASSSNVIAIKTIRKLAGLTESQATKAYAILVGPIGIRYGWEIYTELKIKPSDTTITTPGGKKIAYVIMVKRPAATPEAE